MRQRLRRIVFEPNPDPHGYPYGDEHRNADLVRNSNEHSDHYGHVYADSVADGNRNGHKHEHPHLDTYPVVYAHAHANSFAHPHAHAHPVRYSNQLTVAYSLSHTNIHPHTNKHGNLYAHSLLHAKRHAYSSTNVNGEPIPHRDPDTQRHTNRNVFGNTNGNAARSWNLSQPHTNQRRRRWRAYADTDTDADDDTDANWHTDSYWYSYTHPSELGHADPHTNRHLRVGRRYNLPTSNREKSRWFPEPRGSAELHPSLAKPLPGSLPRASVARRVARFRRSDSCLHLRSIHALGPCTYDFRGDVG